MERDMIQTPSMAKDRRVHEFNIKVTRSAAADSGEVSPLIIRRLAKLDITLEKGIAMLSKEVQSLLDKSREARNMIKAVDAGMGALRVQNEELKSKIDEISNRPVTDPPTGLSADDLAALSEISQGFDDTIESLKDDIPANVEPAPVTEPVTDPVTAGGSSAEPQPQVPDPAVHAQDAEAASQAKPLDGTGAPAPEDKQDPAA